MDINRLCPHCMRETENGKECLYCGGKTENETGERHRLKPFTILTGKYLVGEVLGEGGFGITYIGFDLNLEIRIAIKEFYPSGYVTRNTEVTNTLTAYTGQNMDVVRKWRDSFLKEARSLAKCSHLQGVVGVRDFFQENNTAYIVQEYLEGMTLKEYAKSLNGRIAAEELLPVLAPVFTALGEVHKQGIIHRDISPDNIMRLKDGQMKLLDFGAARDFGQGEEKSLSVLLKYGYAPEEQYRTKGKQGPWTDVYALAGTIYKCLTGTTPPEALERMRQDELRRPGELGVVITPHVENALLKALEVYAENRYQTVEEFRQDLYGEGIEISQEENACKEQELPQDFAGEKEESADKPYIIDLVRKHKWKLAAVFTIVAAVFVVVLLSGNEGRKEPVQAQIGETGNSEEQEDIKEQKQSNEDIVSKQPAKEEILQEFLVKELVPVYGWADLAAKKIYLDGWEEWMKSWTGTAGIAETKIYDFDRDGCEELLVITLDEQNMGLYIYEVEDTAVVKKAEIFVERSGDWLAYEEIWTLISVDKEDYLLFTQRNSGILADGYYANMKLYKYDGNVLYMPMAILQSGPASSDFEYDYYRYNRGGEVLSSEVIYQEYEEAYDNMSAGIKQAFAEYGIAVNDNQSMFEFGDISGGFLRSDMDSELLLKLWMWGEHSTDGYGATYHFNEEQIADYILPDSNSRYLTDTDLAGLTSEQLRLARNEIYARHGRMFVDEELADYFGGKMWYYPSVEEVPDTELNEYELANRDLIVVTENTVMTNAEEQTDIQDMLDAY